MLSWLASLVSRDDVEVDSIVLSGLLAVVAMVVMTAYSLWITPANYSPITFGTGAASVMGAMGAARRLRDGPTNDRGEK